MDDINIQNEPWYRTPEERANFVPPKRWTAYEEKYFLYWLTYIVGMIIWGTSIALMVFNVNSPWLILPGVAGMYMAIASAIKVWEL